MTENMFYSAFFFPAAAVVIVFFMKYVSSVLQARVRLAQDEAYRELATRAAAAQAEAAAAITSLGTSLDEVHSRLTALEKILREVE